MVYAITWTPDIMISICSYRNAWFEWQGNQNTAFTKGMIHHLVNFSHTIYRLLKQPTSFRHPAWEIKSHYNLKAHEKIELGSLSCWFVVHLKHAIEAHSLYKIEESIRLVYTRSDRQRKRFEETTKAQMETLDTPFLLLVIHLLCSCLHGLAP